MSVIQQSETTLVSPRHIPEGIMDFVRSLRLPNGRRLGDVMHLDLWIERDVLTPALAQRTDGMPVHRHLWIELHRGAGKTTLAAVIAIVEAIRAPNTLVIGIASDADQARLLLEAVTSLIRGSPALSAVFRVLRDAAQVIGTGSTIRIMSADAPSFYGQGVACARLRIVADEVCQWPSRAMWDAALTTLPKLADAQLLAITNAGIVGEWQQGARAAIENVGYLFSPHGVVASWITPESLAAIELTVPPAIFRRYYLNEWGSAVGGFLPDMQAWDDCLAQLPPLDDKAEVVVGVDAACVGDCFAILSVTRDPDTKRRDTCVAVRTARIWRPADSGGVIDFDEPRKYLADIVSKHHVVQIAFDEWQLRDFMAQFSRAHSVWCRPFSQQADRAQADTDLLQLIRAGRLKHNGDTLLREHISNAAFKVPATEDSRGRIVKSHPSKKVDAVVALSMAARECLRLRL